MNSYIKKEQDKNENKKNIKLLGIREVAVALCHLGGSSVWMKMANAT
jgi:hypothetical protein